MGKGPAMTKQPAKEGEEEKERDPEESEFGKTEMDFLERALEEMDKVDHTPAPGTADPFEPCKTRTKQLSMRNLVNFRDHKGRTPLHVAAISKNKEVVETLLTY